MNAVACKTGKSRHFIVAVLYRAVRVEKSHSRFFKQEGGVFVLVEVYAEIVALQFVYYFAALIGMSGKKVVVHYVCMYVAFFKFFFQPHRLVETVF